jgi:hypothetical protein
MEEEGTMWSKENWIYRKEPSLLVERKGTRVLDFT